jgi:hypothetical protein
MVLVEIVAQRRRRTQAGMVAPVDHQISGACEALPIEPRRGRPHEVADREVEFAGGEVGRQ